MPKRSNNTSKYPDTVRTVLITTLRSADTIQSVCKDYHSKILKLESEKYDFEYDVARKDYEASSSGFQ